MSSLVCMSRELQNSSFNKYHFFFFIILQIDCMAILEMEDSDLKKFIPAYGDRLATVAFCRKQNENAAPHLEIWATHT